MISSYEGLSVQEWAARTRQLIREHPLDVNEIYEVVLQVWSDIFESGIGSKPFKIGTDLFPRPQIMGFFLHELIPLELAQRHPGIWRREQESGEKDVVYIPDNSFSFEIKTSSSSGSIYGNRSFAQIGATTKKSKSGYYLAVNFEAFSIKTLRSRIVLVRFGWLDHSDWQGQVAATG